MKEKFWVVSVRHRIVNEVVELPDYEWDSEVEKESFIKEQLEMWCEEHYCNWHFSEALISYGHISIDEDMQGEGAEMSEKYLDPPEPVWWAECEICGAKQDCGDMQEVEDDVWVCNLKGTDCLDEWNKQKVEEE